MATVFHDEDADLAALARETVAVVGYGNQGRSQALNLRDSGLRVMVGNIGDAARARAAAVMLLISSTSRSRSGRGRPARPSRWIDPPCPRRT